MQPHIKGAMSVKRERDAVRKQLLTGEIVADIVNGLSKYDVFEKLRLGLYEYQDHEYKETSCYLWWNKAVERLKFANELEMSEKRAILWNRYEQIYKDSVDSGNIINAKSVLDSMAKVFGLQDAEKKEVTITDFKIEFGFNDES